MKNYFTNKTRILKETVLPTIFLLSGLLFLPLFGRYYLLYAAIIIFLYCLLSLQFGYHEITDDALIIRNGLYGFYSKKIRLCDIQMMKVDIGRGYPYIVVFRDSHIQRCFFLHCMGEQSIRPFVEELRSKGVEVKCPPYKYKGRMIYL